MGTKVVVNKKTTVHKKSSGQAPCFPDVCKTPSPGGPVPIPYPNLSSSSTSSKTTKKVKNDKKGASVDGAKFSVSSGDEAGTAGGSVISNRIKGPSYFKNFSFDVKFEKKKVARLTDPKMSNCGSKGAPQPAEAQSPATGSTKTQEEACAELEKTPPKIPDDQREEEFRKHGMSPDHGEAISEACQETGRSCTVRQGNPACIDKIDAGFNAKPKSAKGGTLPKYDKDGNEVPIPGMPDECKGMVGRLNEDGSLKEIETSNGFIPADEVRRMHADDPQGFTNNMKEKGTYTGDYDLHDMYDGRGRIHDRTVPGSEDVAKDKYNSEQKFQNAINDSIARREPYRQGDSEKNMVQHGPQANFKEWVDNTVHVDKNTGEVIPMEEKKIKDWGGREKFDDVMQPDPCRKPPKNKPILHFDENGSVYKIETEEDFDNLYKCKGAAKPAHWK